MPEREEVCRNCGAANPRGNNFCGRCGAFVGAPAAAEEGPRPIVARPGDRRVRRLAGIVYVITALFLLSCVILMLVVIIWRP
ncbi:MAG TPA: zinc ribbon domain-containing protein [Thermomicrobiales bacterium]